MAELANATGLGPVGRKPLEVRVLSPALALVFMLTAAASASTPSWQTATPLPLARTEVAAARLGDEIVADLLPASPSTGLRRFDLNAGKADEH